MIIRNERRGKKIKICVFHKTSVLLYKYWIHYILSIFDSFNHSMYHWRIVSCVLSNRGWTPDCLLSSYFESWAWSLCLWIVSFILNRLHLNLQMIIYIHVSGSFPKMPTNLSRYEELYSIYRHAIIMLSSRIRVNTLIKLTSRNFCFDKIIIHVR